MNEQLVKLLKQAYLHSFKMEITELQDCLCKALNLLEESNAE
jgi:hypothetical protein